MIIDINLLKTDRILEKYDVCICGSGPAGMTAARVLAKKGKKVALLEGGGIEFSDLSQNAYKGDSVGLQYWEGVEFGRLRFFGGTSNHWTGRCSYFDDIDFEQRDYYGLPGWPISRKEIFQNFDAACSVLEITKEGFQSTPNIKWPGESFRMSESTLSPPTRFGQKYYQELKDSLKIDVYINASLTNINLNDAHNAVTSFEIKNYDKKSFLFSASNYVIGLGAIENARVLLNCDKQIKTGIGNQNGMVGRCFMEHLNVRIGNFVANEDPMWQKGVVELNPSADLIRKHQIGNAVLAFERHSSPFSYGRLKVFKQALREMVCKSELATDLSRHMSDFDCPGDGVITSLIEQVPNNNSRIYLGTEKDMFGMRRVKLDWQLSPADYQTIRTLGLEAAKSMALHGSARVQLEDFILDSKKTIKEIGGHAHQMGTTRMSKDPKYGVVNENLQIHGMKNIFVAGSSVFPTGGGCNPTLSIVMLSERLGNYLSKI